MHVNLTDKVNYFKRFKPLSENYCMIKNDKAENDVFINTFATRKKNIIESEFAEEIPNIS